MTATRPTLLATTAAALMLVLAGCGVTGPVGTASPSPSASEADAVATVAVAGPALTGTGPSPASPGLDLSVPDGTRSVTVELTCSGGGPFHVELGDSMMLNQAPLRGTCDGTTTLAWPFTEQTAPTLTVWVLDGVEWEAVPYYSTAEFHRDEALVADCGSFAEVYSAITNAEQGLTLYGAFDEDEWTARMDDATADLDALVATSQSTLTPAFAEILTIVRGPDRQPGSLVPAITPAISPIGSACDANHSPLILTAEFGG